MLASRILFISQFFNDLGDVIWRQVLEVSIADLHRRGCSTRSKALGKVPAEFSVRSYLTSIDSQFRPYCVGARIRSHQPAANVAADLNVVFSYWCLTQQCVKGSSAQHVRWR